MQAISAVSKPAVKIARIILDTTDRALGHLMVDRGPRVIKGDPRD
jgi:hypothetical protein